MTFFPWDEIETLEQEVAEAKKQAISEGSNAKVEELIDSVEDLFEMDYFYGVQDVSAQLGMSLEPNFSDMEKSLNKAFDGKTYKDRIREYFQNGTDYDIARVISTDAHRIYNDAMFDTAKRAGATRKTWHTMQDPRVRDSHDYLEGVTIPLDAEFYSYNGHHTYYPGQWAEVEENANCRCWVTYSL